MKKSFMKKLTAAIGFLAMVFVFTAIPGTKADAATLNTEESELITATEAGEVHTLTMEEDGYVRIRVKSKWTDTWDRSIGKLAVYKGSARISTVKQNDYHGGGHLAIKRDHVFALKKGTYRVKVKMNDLRVTGINGDNMAYDEPNQYIIETHINYVPNQAGTKKSKAATIKLKQVKEGTIALTDAKATRLSKNGQWYKFKLKKKTKVKLNVAAITSNRTEKSQGLTYTVYGSGSKKQLKNFADGKKATLSKGTYYIKFYKTSKSNSGYYKFALNESVKK